MKNCLSISKLGMSLLCVAVMFASNSCKKDKGGMYFGETVTLGGGTAKTYAVLDNDGMITELGAIIDEAAMASLPAMGADLSLDFPTEANATAYTHMQLDWNAMGHEPPGVYDLPHFDFHFYYQTEAERMLIMPTDSNQFRNFPPAGYIPANYITPLPAQGVPMMGVHWIDPSSPEFTPAGFSSTFIYGSYDGEVTFLEPMITKAFIEANATFDANIPQPTLFPVAGKYYPTTYGFHHDDNNNEYHFHLEGFVMH